MERRCVSESALQETLEEGGRQPMDLDPSTEAPGSPQLSIQLPSSLPAFDKIRAPSQAPTMDSGCLGHLPYDVSH